MFEEEKRKHRQEQEKADLAENEMKKLEAAVAKAKKMDEDKRDAINEANAKVLEKIKAN